MNASACTIDLNNNTHVTNTVCNLQWYPEIYYYHGNGKVIFITAGH